MKRIFTALISTIALIAVGLTPASAATMTVTLSKNTFEMVEDSVKITLANFPTKAGIYLQQCAEPTVGTRPTNCNQATQLWVTNSPGGSFLPNADITLKVVSKFGATDCVQTQCGIFARLDHTAGTDTSEDQFQKITFKLPTEPAQTGVVVAAPTITLQKQSLPAILKKISISKKKLALPLKSSGMVKVQYRSASSDICIVNRNVVTLRKTGLCKIQAYAAPNDKFEMFASNLNIQITK